MSAFLFATGYVMWVWSLVRLSRAMKALEVAGELVDEAKQIRLAADDTWKALALVKDVAQMDR